MEIMTRKPQLEPQETRYGSKDIDMRAFHEALNNFFAYNFDVIDIIKIRSAIADFIDIFGRALGDYSNYINSPGRYPEEDRGYWTNTPLGKLEEKDK